METIGTIITKDKAKQAKIKACVRLERFNGEEFNTLAYECDGITIEARLTDEILEEIFKGLSPCDLCRHNPPSSRDGKPCTMCVAEPYGKG